MQLLRMVLVLKAILFDLDGTLLPMEQELFLKAYMGKLVAALQPHGYEPQKLMHTILKGIEAMAKNDGSQSNESAFWNTFASVYGNRSLDDYKIFEDFYTNIFPSVQSVCGFDPMANEVIKAAKERGYRLALATNPMFPKAATYERIRWAGLDHADFDLITTYENCSTSKPNPAYYKDVLRRMNCTVEESLMVGNDVGEDMIPSESIGMQVFL